VLKSKPTYELTGHKFGGFETPYNLSYGCDDTTQDQFNVQKSRNKVLMSIKKTVQTQVARTPSTNLLTSYSSQQYLDIQDTATVSTTLSGCISRIEPGRKPKRLLYMQ
jgi:hypothetical protein